MTKAFIEIQKGSNRKYELNTKTGKLKLDRILSIKYPFAYGFIPETLDDDGDSLDVMILSKGKLDRGKTISIKPIALLKVNDSGKSDDKILAVTARSRAKDLKDVPAPVLEKIGYFFKAYKPRKIQIIGWSRKEQAEKEIEYCAKRYKSQTENG